MISIGSVHAHGATPTPSTSSDAYVVKLSTNPTTIEANKAFTLTLTVLKSDGKTPVTQFDVVHTKLLHLILVTHDLTQFLHVHPDYQGDGVFVLKDLVLSESANYVTYADFTPTGEHQMYVRNMLSVTGGADKQADLAVSPRGVTVGPLKMQLEGVDAFNAGTEINLKFHVTDAQTGTAIDSLDEYLGAAGHLVIIDEANQVYIHTHPAGHEMDGMSGMLSMPTPTPEMAGMSMPMHYGPDLEFMTEFPNVGLWSMWLQIQYQGEVYTFPYVVEVKGTAEGTSETHAHG